MRRTSILVSTSLALFLTLGSVACAGPGTETDTDPGADQSADPSVVEKYNLQVADEPVRERENWRAPERIIVYGADEERMQWLRRGLADVELLAAQSTDDVLAQLDGTDAVMGLCDAQILSAAQSLRWVQLYTAGVEKCINSPEFKKASPLLTNMQHVAAPVIAEHALAMMFSLSRTLPAFQQAAEKGDWDRGPARTQNMQVLNGKTILIAGLGGIGTEIAWRSHALGMTVLATRASSREGPDYVSRVGLPDELPELIEQADIVVNALPLTEQTRNLFDKELFSRMKSSAFFINIGRGGSVVTQDLIDALEQERIAGAGLDVTSPEPLPSDHPLWSTRNTLITPHIASFSDLGREARWYVVRENLRRYVAGDKMLSVVDPGRGY